MSSPSGLGIRQYFKYATTLPGFGVRLAAAVAFSVSLALRAGLVGAGLFIVCVLVLSQGLSFLAWRRRGGRPRHFDRP